MRLPKPPQEAPTRDSLSVEVGGWFKAHATGNGVIAIPIVLAIVVMAIAVQAWLSAG
ncbi:MAG: hypothetical protein Q8Q88_19715 [Phenylobacterium sp.]|uniref:hypothetical protein n=1 Tax=Phenylobacterium sp. TaxID=1871053 RepID=UPI0027339F28|nr:hypothetical protein [Phenylobacterium sp.]MDP3749270.1 hypothetical protein [Phenylobacterium sp.]